MSPPGAAARRALAAALLASACAGALRLGQEPPWIRVPDGNRGAERYSAWFADSDGRVLYFGLSPFWTLWWATGGDPRADLAEPGDHLIGRLDLASGRPLPPLRVRAAGPDSRGSVWDVLAHSNGRIYYTTYFEELGSVSPDGSDVRHYLEAGPGLNELVEGPEGHIFATRYSDRPDDPARQRHGSVAVLTPGGKIVRELPVSSPDGFAAPKSLAVDPASEEIWVNTDTFASGGGVRHETLRLDAHGRVLERTRAPPELHFVAFDTEGRGWFAEDDGAGLRLRVTLRGRELARAALGPRRPDDFVQDIHFAPDGTAALALWSRRAVLARLEEGELRLREVTFEAPSECVPPAGRSLLYTVVATESFLYGTLYCGPTVLRAPLLD